MIILIVTLYLPELLSTTSSSTDPNMNSLPSLSIIAVVCGPHAMLRISLSLTFLTLFNFIGLGN